VALATSRYYQGRYDVAEQDARNALNIVEKLPKSAHTHEVGNITLGLILNKSGRTGEAEPLLRETLTLLQQNSRRPLDVALGSAALGECLALQKRYAEAEPLLLQSYETLKNIQVAASPALREGYKRLASLYAAWGKPSEFK
jgi:tetratricopeptide (TPR) repeat protein